MREEDPYSLLCAACPRAFQSPVWNFEPFPVQDGRWPTLPSPPLPLPFSAKGAALCAVPFRLKHPPGKPGQGEISVYICMPVHCNSLSCNSFWGLRSISGKEENHLIDLED